MFQLVRNCQSSCKAAQSNSESFLWPEEFYIRQNMPFYHCQFDSDLYVLLYPVMVQN